MGVDLPRMAIAVVVVSAVGAAAFRVATAPQRVQERRDTARSVCLASKGEWTVVDGSEVCRRDDGWSNRGS
jgi:hypothetical protein